MKKYCWVYMDVHTEDLVLVMRPHRRSISPRYRVLAGIWKRAGFRPDKFLGVSGRGFDREEFKARYKYVSGLNTGSTLYKRFKEIYMHHGVPFVCRQLNIDMDQYNQLRRKALSQG